MLSIARSLMLIGFFVLLMGGLLYVFVRLGIPFGQLPGDIRIQGERVSCLVPLASSLLISIILTVILNLVIRMLNR